MGSEMCIRDRMQKELPDGVVAHPYYLKFQLGAYEKPQSKTSYWVPTFTFVAPISPEEYNTITALKKKLQIENISAGPTKLLVSNDSGQGLTGAIV